MKKLFIFVIFISASFALGETKMNKVCPDRPSCVSSFKEGNKERNFVEPVSMNLPKEKAYEVSLKVLEKMKGAKVVHKSDDLIKAEFTSSFFKFVDDMELYFGEAGKIHFYSVSRKGYYDFGANRSRVEDFKFQFFQSGFLK